MAPAKSRKPRLAARRLRFAQRQRDPLRPRGQEVPPRLARALRPRRRGRVQQAQPVPRRGQGRPRPDPGRARGPGPRLPGRGREDELSATAVWRPKRTTRPSTSARDFNADAEGPARRRRRQRRDDPEGQAAAHRQSRIRPRSCSRTSSRPSGPASASPRPSPSSSSPFRPTPRRASRSWPSRATPCSAARP